MFFLLFEREWTWWWYFYQQLWADRFHNAQNGSAPLHICILTGKTVEKIIGFSAVSYQTKHLRQIWLETLFCNSLETLITKVQIFSLAEVKWNPNYLNKTNLYSRKQVPHLRLEHGFKALQTANNQLVVSHSSIIPPISQKSLYLRYLACLLFSSMHIQIKHLSKNHHRQPRHHGRPEENQCKWN